MRSLQIILAGAALLLVAPGAAAAQSPGALENLLREQQGALSDMEVYVEQLGGDMFLRPAQGYTWVSGQSQEVEYENTTWKVLGGGLQTNVLDLARFGALTLSGAIVSNTARLWTDLTAGGSSWDSSESPITSTGLGWRVSDRGPELSPGVDRAAADHGGDAPGAGTLIRIYRDGDLVIAIMANQQESSILLKTNGTPAGHPVEALATRMAGAVFRP